MYGSTGYNSSNTIHYEYLKAQFEDGISSIGESLATAKSRLDIENSSHRWNIFTVNLLGDPASKMNYNCQDSDLILEFTGPRNMHHFDKKQLNTGDQVLLSASVHLTCGQPYSEANVIVEFNNGQPDLALGDDGLNGDIVAGDGIYSAYWTPTIDSEDTKISITASDGEHTPDYFTYAYNVISEWRYPYDDSVEFNWIDTTDASTVTFPGDGNGTIIPIGFDFEFYGDLHNSIAVFPHGYISFSGETAVGTSLPSIPTPQTPNGYMAVLAKNFATDGSDPAKGQLYTKILGTAPNRQFVVTWSNFSINGHYNQVTFQVILFEGTNEFKYQYLDVDSGNEASNGATSVVGVENPEGNYGEVYSFNEPKIFAEMAILFTPIPPVFECQYFSATNSEHETAGRAYSTEECTGTLYGTYCLGGSMVTTWFAVGSDENLGTSGSTVTSLHTEPGRIFAAGSCPTPDVTAPVITIVGDDPLYVNQGSEFIDPGATATDNIDGDITANIVVSGTIDTAANVGTQSVLTYSISDAAGNTAEATRIVQIIEAPACVEYTDTVANHESANRAYSTEECTGTLYGTYCFGGSMITTWYATGSNENLGTDGSATVTLKEEPVDSGIFATGTCPIQDQPPQIDSTSVEVNSNSAVISGTASDPDGDLEQVILYFAGGGVHCEGTDTFTCPEILNLQPGNYTAFLKAVDSRLVDSGMIEVPFTVEGPSAPSIDSYTYDFEGNKLVVNGTASDADGDLSEVHLLLGLGGRLCTGTGTFTCELEDLVKDTTYNVALQARDAAGNESIPTEFSFTYTKGSAPVIEAWNYEVTGNDLVVTGTSSDIDNDITSTVVYINSGIGVTCEGIEQWSCEVNNIPVGTHTVNIETSDSYSNDSNAIEFDVTIEASQAPSIDSYETNITGDTLTITGTASDPDGDLETIYYNNGSTYYTCTGTENFTCTITGLAIGDYSVELLALDATGTESERVTVEYQYNGQAPVIETHSYATDGLTITFTGTASDVDGNLDRVVLTLGAAGGVLCTGTETFTCTWTAEQAGTYQIGLAAYDALNLVGTIPQIDITVADQGECITDTNFNHVEAGRAYVGGLSNLYAYATGSDDDLGLYGSSYYSTSTSLEETSQGYWTKVDSCP